MSKSITSMILENVSSTKRLVEMPEGGDSPMGLLGRVLDTATAEGWSYEEIDFANDEGGYEFYQYSPAGEDFSFAACYGGKDLSEDEKGRNLIEDIESYADDFDEEEHAEMWIGGNGAPGLKALVQDAEDIHDMLISLADELRKINHPMNESYVYNWRDDVEEVEATEENDDIWYAVAENMCETGNNEGYGEDPYEVMSNIISLWKVPKRSRLYRYLLKWYGSEDKLQSEVRDIYETNDAIYFTTGCGYSIFDADLLGGNADGTTAKKFDDFVAKEEGLNEGVLEPRFSSRKSFYGKAGTDDTEDGKVLTSYQTKIMKIKDGKITMLCGPEALTNTTLRHVREFLQQNGLEPMTKKQLVDLINSQGINESQKLDDRFWSIVDRYEAGKMTKDEVVAEVTEMNNGDKAEIEADLELIFDPGWACAECGKKKQDYEAMYCDKCWNTKPELRGEGLRENKALDLNLMSYSDWKGSEDYWGRLNDEFGVDSETDLETHGVTASDIHYLYNKYIAAVASGGKVYTKEDYLDESAKVRFKKLNEAGEWDDYDEDNIASKEYLTDIAKEIADNVPGGYYQDAVGFDAYQGPYAVVGSDIDGGDLWYYECDDLFELETSCGWIVGSKDELIAALSDKDYLLKLVEETKKLIESASGLKESTKVKLTEAPSDDISRDEEEYELVDNAPEDIPPEEVDNAEEGEMSDDEYEEEAEDDAKETVKDDIEEPWYATTPELDELRDILPDLDYRLYLINTDMICVGRLNGPDIEILTSNAPSIKDEAEVSEANDKAEEVEERAEENEEDSFEYLWIKAPASFDEFVKQVNVVYLSPEMTDEDKEQYAGLEVSHESLMDYLMNELPEDKRKEHEKEEPEEAPTEEPVEELPAELPAGENEVEITVGEEEPTEEEEKEKEEK